MRFFTQVTYKKGIAIEIRDLLETTRVVLIKGYRGNNPFQSYDRLSDEIGEWAPMEEDIATGNKTGAKWIEIKYDPQFPDNYRYSSVRQPLHTDGSYEENAPDVSFFFCLKAPIIGGGTVFVDSDSLMMALERYSRELLRACCEVPVTFAKGGDSKTKSIITTDAKGLVLTWNYFRVIETSPEVAALRKEFHRFLEEKVVGGGLCLSCHLKPGEAVFFTDERLLHGRNSFIANRAGDRHLLKCGLRLVPNPRRAEKD